MIAHSDVATSRQRQARRQIVNAAWELADAHGTTRWTLAQVARRVGMRAPSLYEYFPSKAAILAAMVEQVERELHTAMEAKRNEGPDSLLAESEAFIEFCRESPCRFWLVFSPDVPPASAHSGALMRCLNAGAAGAVFAEHVDLQVWHAVLVGIAADVLLTRAPMIQARTLLKRACVAMLGDNQQSDTQALTW